MTDTEIDLYGRGRILRFVSDGLDRSRDRDTPPITLLVGPRGSGKTVLLDRLEADHRRGSPTARLNFGPSPDASPEAVLLDIGYKLSPGVPRVGKVRLPLLGLGFLAVGLDPESRASPAEQLGQLLDTRGQGSGQMLANLGKQIGTLLPSPEQKVIVAETGAALAWIADAINRRRLNDYLAWYGGAVGQGNGTRVGPLLLMHEWWREAHTPGGIQARQNLWRVLCAALLADLRTGFNKAGWTHGLRTTNCLLLLDDTDGAAGTEFLETLAECRSRDPGDPDPLLVVAAQGRRPELDPAVGPAGLPDDRDLDYARWLAATRQLTVPGSPWYPVFLAELDDANVTPMVTTHVLGKATRDVDFVRDVGGGNPAAVAKLAARLTLVSPDFDPRLILSRELEDELLAGLRPTWLGEKNLLAMSVFAVALRPRLKAVSSVFRSLQWTNISELDVRDLLLSLMWATEGSGGSLDIRPLPRLLLTRLLARDEALWSSVHDGYLTHYRTQAGRDELAEHYHLLALTVSLSPGGSLGPVTAYLDRRLGPMSLGEQSLSEWNGLLADIATAPNRLRPRFDGEPEEAVRQLAGIASPGDGLPRIISRLVAARWLYNDRLFDPQRRLARLLDREYYELAQLIDQDCQVLYDEVTRFRTVAHNWEGRS